MNKASRSRALGWAALGLLGAAVVQSCSASDATDGPSSSGGTAGTSFPEAGDGETGIVNPPDDGGAGGRSPYNPLCGAVDCLPDRPDACPPTTSADLPSDPSAGGTPGDAHALPGAAGGSAGGADDGGAPGDGGRGGSTAGAGGQAGVSGTAGRAGSGGTGPTTVVNACQVRVEDDRPRAKCGPAGTGAVDAPCLSDSNCAPGLACVREGDAGQCRAYCCDEQSCSDRTHCLERPLFGVRPALTVPVCVPAVDCGLAEPYPCPDGATCSCPNGLACMVAGADRSTTCVEPGDGMEGDQCPCYWGHVCSNVTNRCVKLCQTTAPELACTTGICQASAELPAGWGVCVGATRPDAG